MCGKKTPPAPPPGIIDLVRSYIFGDEKSEASGRKYKVVNDGKEFDFTALRDHPRSTNIIETIANLVKGCLGGGIMGIHEAFMKAGLWSATIMCVVFAFYIYHCAYILSYAAQILYRRLHLPFLSYPDVAEACLEVGPKSLRKYSRVFRYSIDMVIMIDLYGATSVYLVIIAKTIKQLILGEDDIDNDNIVRIYIACLYVPVMILGMMTTLKYIARVSILGNVLMLICVSSTVFYGYTAAPPISTMPFFRDIWGFFEFCGVGAFSMECLSLVLPVENVMRKPKKFAYSLKIAYIFISLFVISTGFFGYWGYGDHCESPIHLNFPRDTYALILKGLMAVMVYFTFAIIFYAPFNLAWYYIGKRYLERKLYWERVYRFIIITAVFFVAIAFPNIGNLMGLLGAFCSSLIVFVFPPIIELVVVWETPGLGRFNYILYKNIILMVGGGFFLIVGVYTNGLGLIKSLA